jgi:hypothetical protein
MRSAKDVNRRSARHGVPLPETWTRLALGVQNLSRKLDRGRIYAFLRSLATSDNSKKI